MKNNVTELVFILDRSGSMGGFEGDAVGGFNAMIEKQKETEGRVLVSTVLFSNTSSVLHDRRELSEIPPMTLRDYAVGGCTALLDAIGGAIHHIGNVHKYAREEDVPAHTMFVITTDGMENASRIYGSEEVKRMIAEREERDGWEFLFVAANIDAVETAAKIGIRRERAASYDQSREGFDELFCMLGDTVTNYRRSATVKDDWATRGDRKKRTKKDKKDRKD